MVAFKIAEGELDLPRNIALLDTNVLVAYVNPADQHHAQASLFIESEDKYILVVTPPVIVEACGLLSKRRDRQLALGLLAWIRTPGKVMLLPTPYPPLETEPVFISHSDYMKVNELDYVDTYLMETANRISRVCDLRPFLPIVTFDTGDFLKCATKGYTFSLYDMHELALQEFQFD